MSGLSRSNKRSPSDQQAIAAMDRGLVSGAVASSLMEKLNSVRGVFNAAHNFDRGGHEQHFDHS